MAGQLPPGGPKDSSKNESPGLHHDQASGLLLTSPEVSSWILEELMRDKAICSGGVPTFPALSWQVLWDHTAWLLFLEQHGQDSYWESR